MLKPYELGDYVVKSRDEVLGKPLSRAERLELVKRHVSSNRFFYQLMSSNPFRQVSIFIIFSGSKTGGKIILRTGGVLYLFRGRHYDPHNRPKFPVMLWKPATPVYPKLIQAAPEGLTKEEAEELRMKGKNLPTICKLAKNGVYLTLVKDARHAFEESTLVKIDCRGMHASDYKKIGAKLKELVPCVLLSFDDEQILIWRGHGWKSMYRGEPIFSSTRTRDNTENHPSSDSDDDYGDFSEKSAPPGTLPVDLIAEQFSDGDEWRPNRTRR